ncbi:MAG: glycoside hydrolase family 95-like protein [bacterium]
MKYLRTTIVISLSLFIDTSAAFGSPLRPFDVDTASYVSRHDIVYLSPPTEGYEGFPIGNGDLGGMIWCGKAGVEMQINKVDTFGPPTEESQMVLRSCGRLSLDFGAPCFEWLYLENFEGRLSLGQATATFDVQTPFMKLVIDSCVQVNRNVILITCRSEALGDLAENGAQVRVALERWGSRAFPGWYSRFSHDPQQGLGTARAGISDRDITLEESLGDLEFAIACRVIGAETTSRLVSRRRAELDLPPKPRQTFSLLVAVVTTNESDEPLAAARSLLDKSEQDGVETLRDEHKRWWEDFWRRSFVHIGHDYIENLYYFKRYLMASSSRGRYPVLFNAGIWTWNHDVRNWVTPHHWNMQQSYWGLCASNDCDLLRPYLDAYWRLVPMAREHAKMRGAENAVLWSEGHDYAGRMCFWDRSDMLNNFTPASQIAEFFWDYYRYTGDITFLEERAYPFMKMAAEFYLEYLQWDDVKKEFFIFPSQPYESPQGNRFRNPITDLGMIESTFQACIQASEILDVDTEKRAQWQNVIEHLWEPPMMTWSGVGEVFGDVYQQDGTVYPPAEKGPGAGHFHFSANTSLVFPAGLITLDQRETRYFQAAARLIDLHPPDKNAITPAPIVAARLGMADQSLRNLKNSVRRLQHFPQGLFYNIDHWYIYSRFDHLLQNPDILAQRDYIYDRQARYSQEDPTEKGVYTGANTEHGGTPTLPFVQCGLEPLGILGAAVNEMLLQSYEGKIRVFPATPDPWPAAFTLRAVGGFLVSSEREKESEPKSITIESLAGKECRVVNPWPNRTLSVVCIQPEEKSVPHSTPEENLIVFPTLKGGIYRIEPLHTDGASAQRTHFPAIRNTQPKRFEEAVLGKPRDF